MNLGNEFEEEEVNLKNESLRWFPFIWKKTLCFEECVCRKRKSITKVYYLSNSE